MIIIKHIQALKKQLQRFSDGAQTIGFVPTMGALHAGHISLIQKAKESTNVVVFSIFVNPTQFNNATDLAKYPQTLEADIEKLELAHCDFLFLPEVEEMYPANEVNKTYDLGYIETILEGAYRPGHFQGVCIIVDKLLLAVKPNILYLGRKDYQQCMVVKKMMELENHTAKLQICETVRETDGLAMSSRNMRLNKTERQTALIIINVLQQIKTNLKEGDLQHLKTTATKTLIDNGYKVDYVEIANALTLQPISHWDGQTKLVALVAAYLNEIRLIDNILL
jgi:pantoate--beta-alanine ligase